MTDAEILAELLDILPLLEDQRCDTAAFHAAIAELRWRADVATVIGPQDPQWSVLPPLAPVTCSVFTLPALTIDYGAEALVEDYIKSRRAERTTTTIPAPDAYGRRT